MAYIRQGLPAVRLFDTKLTRKEKADAFRFLAAQSLSKRGFHPVFEVKLDLKLWNSENYGYQVYLWGRRADVLAINSSFDITIVEVKSSKEDFNTDSKWTDYLKACDSFYFCSDEKTIEHIAQAIKGHEKAKKIGLMVCDLEHMTLMIEKPIRKDQSLEIPTGIRMNILYEMVVAGDVFLGGSYLARFKPSYSYLDKPYINMTE